MLFELICPGCQQVLIARPSCPQQTAPQEGDTATCPGCGAQLVYGDLEEGAVQEVMDFLRAWERKTQN